MMTLSKENDRWLDDYSEFCESGSTGGDWFVYQGAVEDKLLELEAEIAKLRNGLERVEDTKNLEDAWDIAEAVLAHKEQDDV